ncbi:glycosyltransferase family 61 protein [Pseudomonas sp. SWI6]|uniref:Glycosyltransferase family 61 protein n=1 Tax=Pseudomonas taiwanensis TaxID=470150 RepID=A0ABR6VDB7_9PSED|nr:MULTISPECIES: glycosyltransferase family 61 protein [Pseudomonas]AVD83335.1 glycosyltransferase family 61 protein [Pseudomonas sp. SWI6]MBC3478533.1 glycosyltransferase family 61 protein [Pseudomonas taiwanensis]MBC3493458.1 glycosyltransferase family 61 protein [Pseudomonas taiwanensis]MDT8921583.1 glycosyltransferase family 61 protein [Pseudomonas taiwanensis]MPS98980.1 glycosyltransferase family 61 protein [Pseudomonas sp.]
MGSDVTPFSATPARGRKKLTLAAYKYIARKRFSRQAEIDLKSIAEKSWEIAPSETTVSPRAIFLPNQLERVTGWEFHPFEHPRRTMEGGLTVDHGATRGYLIKDVWLIDGALYKDDACHWLSLRPTHFPGIVVEHEIERAAAYCTLHGNSWFGTWLMEDCATYPLACNEGVPITTAPSAKFPLFAQAPAYEDWLGMRPLRLRNAFIRELVLFDDQSNNRNRHLRYRGMGEKLLSHVEHAPHPGVFLLRGGDGELRLLRNELEIAEHLRKHRGFRIINPLKTDVPSIVAACAGARTVIGVEGSQLAHGVNVLQDGGSVLALQPPNRFVSYYKFMTDRDHQHFGFVVGTPDGEGFKIDIDEVERTLDLLPS